jgi:hypothetical protein
MIDRRTRTTRGKRVAIIVFTALAGCTTSTPDAVDARYVPILTATDCPRPVRVSATRETTCSYLTVPEDRSDPEGRQIRLFVTRIEPHTPTSAPPLIYVGSDLGLGFDYRALAEMADHLDDPEVIGIESRGTGYSEPNLACPEVDALSAASLTVPIGDAGLRRSFLDAVAACFERFTAQGIDPSSFGVEQAGADLLDLVAALHLSKWDVATKGSTSRIVFAAMRSNPPGLRALIAHYPEFPDTDVFTQAIEATRASISELGTLCEADARCAGSFPDLAATFDEAIRRFDADPRAVRIDGSRIVVDGARLLRDFRHLLATIRADDPMVRHLPATIDALAHSKNPTSALVAVVSPEVLAPAFCTGYLPVCNSPTSQGAYYSALCQDIAPFADRGALPAVAGEEIGWIEDYVDGPYGDVCRAWTVSPADDSVGAKVESDVPMLVFSGGLNPFITPDATREGLARSPEAFLVVTPIASHQLATIAPCALTPSPRREFLSDPTTAPDTSCQEGFQPRFATTPLSS